MKRRNILLGLGAAAAGSGAVFGSGAFTQVQADRDLTIGIEQDSSALLELNASSDVASVTNDNNGELVINTDNLGGGDGFAVGSTVDIGEIDDNGDVPSSGSAFTLTNNFDDVGDSNADLAVAIGLTSIDLGEVSELSSLEFYGTPSNGNGTQVIAAGEREVFDVSSGDQIDFAIRFETASTTDTGDFDATVTFQAGSDLTSEDFPTEAPNQIQDWNDLAAISDDLSASYNLVNDLDADTDGYTSVVEESGFDPLGTFSGTLDGNGYTISNLSISADSRFAGLFSIVTGTIKNITIDSATVSGSKSFVGVLAGNFAGTARDVSVINSDVTGEGYAGGLVGALNGGVIKRASVSGSGKIKVDPDNTSDDYKAGGIAGAAVNSGGEIRDSETNITVKGARHIGGIVGFLQAENISGVGTTKITGTKATGKIKGTSLSVDGNNYDNGQNIGGLVGSAEFTGALSIEKSYTTATIKGTENVGGLLGNDVNGRADVTINQSYSVADIKSDGGNAQGNIGGLVGKGAPDIDNSYAAPTIRTDVDGSGTGASDVGGVVGSVNSQSEAEGTDTYWDTVQTGTTSAVGDGSLTATPLTTTEIQGSSASTNMSGLDFDSTDPVWQTNSGDYPTLR